MRERDPAKFTEEPNERGTETGMHDANQRVREHTEEYMPATLGVGRRAHHTTLLRTD